LIEARITLVEHGNSKIREACNVMEVDEYISRLTVGQILIAT
jgi:hypothetical protein